MEQEPKHNDPSRAARQFELMFPHASSECLDSRINPPTPVMRHEEPSGPLVTIYFEHRNADGELVDVETVFRNEEGRFITKDGTEVLRTKGTREVHIPPEGLGQAAEDIVKLYSDIGAKAGLPQEAIEEIKTLVAAYLGQPSENNKPVPLRPAVLKGVPLRRKKI